MFNKNIFEVSVLIASIAAMLIFVISMRVCVNTQIIDMHLNGTHFKCVLCVACILSHLLRAALVAGDDREPSTVVQNQLKMFLI